MRGKNLGVGLDDGDFVCWCHYYLDIIIVMGILEDAVKTLNRSREKSKTFTVTKVLGVRYHI